MLQHTKQGEELMTLAVAAEEHLRAQGREVTVKPTGDVKAFEVRWTGNDRVVCRVQAVGRETFEIARPGSDTFTGFGDENVMFGMLDRIVAEMARKAA